jgi:hypothetical protein
MNNAQQLPDLAKSFAKLKLADVLATNNHPSITAAAWAHGAQTQLPAVLNEIRQQAGDNYVLVAEIIGNTAMVLIDRIFPELANQWRARMLTNQIDLC